MLPNIYFIAKKDFLYSLKEKTLLVWLFIMPIVFFGFIGSTTGGFAGRSSQVKANIAIWEQQIDSSKTDPLAKQILYRLEQENFNVLVFNNNTINADIKYHFEDYTRRLWLPADLQEKLKGGEQIEIEYDSSATGLGQNNDQFSIEKALYQTLGDVLVAKKLNGNKDLLDFNAVNQQHNNIVVEVSSAGEKQDIPSGFKQAVPGILVMFIMMIALSSGSLSVFLERKSGVLKRLAATPLTRKEIILGKWLGKWFITLLQMLYGMLIGWLLFKIHWGDHLGAIVFILLLWAAFNAALAVLLGSFAQSEGQVSAIATISSLLLAALGGCWWPIEITPQWMQSLANFLPTGWIMDAMHKLMYFGGQLQDVSLHMLAMVVLSLTAVTIAFNKFKFS
ncbi:MAG TPA: ABC transporter permease [Oceanospirillales bacterium]|nr:ABC transporter permease [Oceanospirillales bacterium]